MTTTRSLGSRWSALLSTALMLVTPAFADIPLPLTPNWESTPNSHVATGGAWADVDGDGYLDMIAANGNDIFRQSVVVYHNNGDGTLPLNPTWSSSDLDYHGHLDVGDINGDGLVDVAVAVFLGPAGFSEPGQVKVYLNNGAGAFSSTPDWISAEDFYCFSVALGDADGDGDLDLACAAGEPYTPVFEKYRIFYNNGGVLETTSSWKTDATEAALDVTWDDVDDDGDMDLAFSGMFSPVQVYENQQTDGGGIPTTPSWESTDLPQQGNTASFGDWNGDGFPELALADNFQLAGPGRFKVYPNNGGVLATEPVWQSASGGYGSNVSWIDLDFDGDRDLATGRWFDLIRIYENTGGTLTTTPVWSSISSSVIENLFWGDLDNDGLRSDGISSMIGDGKRTFFRVGQSPLRSIDEVLIDGVPTEDFVAHPANGWISFSTPPTEGSVVRADFTYSVDVDMGVTNWDSSKGNYVFLNDGTAAAPDLADAAFAFRAFPNPIRTSAKIRYSGGPSPGAAIAIYGVTGRQVRSLHDGPLNGGLQIWEWDRRDDSGRRVAAGSYYAMMRTAGGESSVKLLVID